MTRTTCFLAGLIFIGTATALAIPDTLSGHAQVVDGDTLKLNGQRIRLWGIDAPELSQPCGRQAADKLRELTNDVITCTIQDTDRYNRIVAQCYSVDGDLAGLMVGAGLAEDYPRYSRGHYARFEVKDRCAFTSPQKWRAGQQKP